MTEVQAAPATPRSARRWRSSPPSATASRCSACRSCRAAWIIGKSTVHRILATLVADGFVERTADERYRLSLKLYEIGQQVAASSELRERAHSSLERLRNESGETAHLAVLAGTDVVYVDRLESPQMLHMLTRVGRRRAAHATSSGQVPARLRPAGCDVDRVVAGGLPRLVRARSRRPSAPAGAGRRPRPRLRGERRGVGPWRGVRARAGLQRRRCVAAMSVAGPITRMPADQLDRIARLVLRRRRTPRSDPARDAVPSASSRTA